MEAASNYSHWKDNGGDCYGLFIQRYFALLLNMYSPLYIGLLLEPYLRKSRVLNNIFNPGMLAIRFIKGNRLF
ncbi:hypothetical protein SAMN05421747_11731 [Parapedobacter composti]|uniref:Uncharacterized protein n=1 Tax=Parapedobacter composti TaxID=623281 RepID=A0A1I1KTZ6_9SPHI|nr:hypothetical protein SAMN05421747_11731 [Parapedobacter composti]